MRILLASGHRARLARGRGAGQRPLDDPSGAIGEVHDLLARGLSELGHEVRYLVAHDPELRPPPGVVWATTLDEDVDIVHNARPRRGPWVQTIHRWMDELGDAAAPRQWIHVSRSLARLHQSERYVHNGIDPSLFTFREDKEEHVLFLASMQGPRHAQKYHTKGLDIALEVCREAGVPLVVAGTARDEETLAHVRRLCAQYGARYVGDVRGAEKAALLAGARGLLLPTRIPEGFGLVLVEALVSGTPILVSPLGACPEIATPDTGRVCAERADWIKGLHELSRYSARACRQSALDRFHYLQMARGYVREYERELSR